MEKRFAVTREASPDNRGGTVVDDCFPQKYELNDPCSWCCLEVLF